MAVAYQSVGTLGWAAITNGGTIVVPKPSSLALTDMMVAHIAVTDEDANTASVTPPAGWTSITGAVLSDANGMAGTVVFWKIADSGDVSASNFTFTNNSGELMGMAGAIYRISGVGSISSAGATVAGGTSPSFANTITPTVANNLLLFLYTGTDSVGSAQTVSGYAITTDNPTWTERYDQTADLFGDFGSGNGITPLMSGATATRSAITATGNSTCTITTDFNYNTGVIVVLNPTVDATVTPTVMDITASIQAPLIGITILPTVMSIVSSIVSPVVTALSSIFTNTTKNVGTWTNTSKNASSAITDSFAVKPTTATRTNFTGSLGMRFTVSEPITVSQLGRLYVAGNSQNHTINLWISTDTVTPIASVTLTSSLTSDANNFKYDDITPVVLTPGNTYAIASNETSGGDAWKDLWAYGSDIQSVFTDKFAVYHGTANTYPSLGATPSNIYNTCAMKYVTGVTFSNQSKNVATWTNQSKS